MEAAVGLWRELYYFFCQVLKEPDAQPHWTKLNRLGELSQYWIMAPLSYLASLNWPSDLEIESGDVVLWVSESSKINKHDQTFENILSSKIRRFWTAWNLTGCSKVVKCLVGSVIYLFPKEFGIGNLFDNLILVSGYIWIHRSATGSTIIPATRKSAFTPEHTVQGASKQQYLVSTRGTHGPTGSASGSHSGTSPSAPGGMSGTSVLLGWGICPWPRAEAAWSATSLTSMLMLMHWFVSIRKLTTGPDTMIPSKFKMDFRPRTHGVPTTIKFATKKWGFIPICGLEVLFYNSCVRSLSTCMCVIAQKCCCPEWNCRNLLAYKIKTNLL